MTGGDCELGSWGESIGTMGSGDDVVGGDERTTAKNATADGTAVKCSPQGNLPRPFPDSGIVAVYNSFVKI